MKNTYRNMYFNCLAAKNERTNFSIDFLNFYYIKFISDL